MNPKSNFTGRWKHDIGGRSSRSAHTRRGVQPGSPGFSSNAGIGGEQAFRADFQYPSQDEQLVVGHTPDPSLYLGKCSSADVQSAQLALSGEFLLSQAKLDPPHSDLWSNDVGGFFYSGHGAKRPDPTRRCLLKLLPQRSSSICSSADGRGKHRSLFEAADKSLRLKTRKPTMIDQFIRAFPPLLGAAVLAMALELSTSVGVAQPHFVQVGTLPHPGASDRVEVFAASTRQLFSFPTYEGGYVADGYVSPQSATDTFAFSTLPGLASVYWGRVACDGTNVYTVGGYGVAAYSIRYVPVSAPSAWRSTVDVPNLVKPIGRALHQTFLYRGRMYVLGGWHGDGQPLDADVEYAPVQSDGSIGAFLPTTSLPVGMAGHSATVSSNGVVYVAHRTNLYSAQIAADGSVGAWRTEPTVAGLDHNNVGNTGLTIVGNTLVIVDSSKTFFCRLGASGTLDSLITSITNPVTFSQRSLYSNGDKVYLAAPEGGIYRIEAIPQETLPAISVEPQSQTVAFGDSVTFAVTAAGSPTPSYQWLFKGVAVDGATNNIFTIQNLQPRDAGGYSVVVSNRVGAATSVSAILIVQIPYKYTVVGSGWVITGYTGGGGAISIPASINGIPVVGIGTSAFESQDGLTQITLPDSVTSIGMHAFIGCYSLTSFTIPSRVTSIGEGPFAGDIQLSAISVNPANSSFKSVDGVLFNGSETTLIQWPAGKTGSYSIPNGVARIGGWAFDIARGLTNITIPSSITSIGESAFSDCKGLNSIGIPSSVRTITSYAFGNCTNLSSVVFSGNAPVADSTLFYHSTKATVYFLPGTTGWGPTFGGAPAVLRTPKAATAAATVVNGFLVGASISDPGLGYTNTPIVRVIGGNGTGAQAVAVVSNGIVTAVKLLAAGSGYTTAPVIVIAPPFIPQPTIGIKALVFGPLATPVIRLDFTNLSPYDNYQLEFTAMAGGAWTNLGAPFVPTGATNTQYADGVGSAGFLRVRHDP